MPQDKRNFSSTDETKETISTQPLCSDLIDNDNEVFTSFAVFAGVSVVTGTLVPGEFILTHAVGTRIRNAVVFG